LLEFLARSAWAGGVAADFGGWFGGCGGWFTIRTQLTSGCSLRGSLCGDKAWPGRLRGCFFYGLIGEVLALEFVPVGGTAVVHDGADVLLDSLEEVDFGFLFGLWRLHGEPVLLKFAELVEGAVEDAGGVGPGSFDGTDLRAEHGVEERIDGGVLGDVAVDEVAATESPRGAGDFRGEKFFDGVDGVAAALHVDAEHIVNFGFFGEDEIGLGVQAVGYGVARGGVVPFGGACSCGFFRVAAVGVDL